MTFIVNSGQLYIFTATNINTDGEYIWLVNKYITAFNDIMLFKNYDMDKKIEEYHSIENCVISLNLHKKL